MRSNLRPSSKPHPELSQSFPPAITVLLCHLQSQNSAGIGKLFSPDASLQAPLAGGILRGPALIEAHFRHAFRRFAFQHPVTITLEQIELTGRKAFIRLHQAPSAEDQGHPIHVHIHLHLDVLGLIQEAEFRWDPRPWLKEEAP
jgi:hypothetical protein